MKYPLAQQSKPSPAIHRSFEQLQLRDMAFNHAVVDRPSQPSLYRVFVLFYSGSKGLEFWQLALCDFGQPGV